MSEVGGDNEGGAGSREFRSPETMLVTERTFDQYLERFDIPAKYFEDRGIVLDVGSGLADFVRQTNGRYSDTGTRAIGIDPIYSLLERDYEEFEKKADKAHLPLSFDYGRDFYQGRDLNDTREAIKQFYLNFYNEVTKSGNYIAGSHQALPFREGSIDFIVANNSVFQFDNIAISIMAMMEIMRVLKDDGEARIAPTNLEWAVEQGATLEKKNTLTKRDIQDLQDTGTIKEEFLFELFKYLEKQGSVFYMVLVKSSKNDEGKAMPLCIVCRKDEQIPSIDTGDNNFRSLRRLHFQDSEDNYHITSEEVNLLPDNN